ncbi:hypothetical protein EIKCOROL_00648 [Eikenella corrodens ATCC 23834]|uniref:Uncharacterized protein n=1 Tax=Eikenella corrodens ATCC 23834 TaxID=546274 RepID=C0DTH0_EIKCO|nr:hypothetical protein EIKCOROL_00648 [Eikenella corrodens ATCC 23834]
MKLKLVEQFSGSLNFMMETFKGENYVFKSKETFGSIARSNRPFCMYIDYGSTC